MLWRNAGQGSEYGAVSNRRDQSSGGCAAGCKGGVQPPVIYRCTNRRAERPEQWRHSWQRRRETGRYAAVARYYGVLADWFGGGRVLPKWNSARHLGSGTAEECGWIE